MAIYSSGGILSLRLLVAGCTPLARKTLVVATELVDLVGVVNLAPDLGRGKSNYEALVDFASQRPEDIHYTSDINSAYTVDWIVKRRPDIILQLGWSQIFNRALLQAPRMFCVGIHPSPLPAGRGAAILNWKLIEGGGAWGNSLFIMEEKTDTGDILDFEPFELEPRDDIRTAYHKVDWTAIKMLRRTLPRLADGTFVRRPQEHAKATRYYKRRPEDGRLDPCWSSTRFVDFIRAMTHPYPGAFLDSPIGRVWVWQAKKGDGSGGAPGRVIAIVRGRGMQISVGDRGSVWLERVSGVEECEMWADDWAHDHGIGVGSEISAVA
jgi:methionyl-tRNA formyltransferase